MELRHLRYFIAIAEEASISRAAARLHVAQPALSRQLHDLEDELGGTLCIRSTEGVSLTPAGKLLLKHARKIAAEVENALQDVRQSLGKTEERLVIGFLGNYHLDHLKPALDRFRILHPLLKLDFNQGMQSEQLAAVRNGEMHVAFINMPAHLNDLTHEVVMRVPLVAVLPSGHRLLKRKSLRIEDLTDEPFVFTSREPRPEFYDHIHSLFAAAGIRPNTVREVGGPLDTVVGLVKMGLGLTLLPLYKDAPRSYKVEWRPLKPSPHIEFALVWKANGTAALVEELCAIVHEELPLKGSSV